MHWPNSHPAPRSGEWISRKDLEQYAPLGIVRQNLRRFRLVQQRQQHRATRLWYALRCGYRSYRAHKELLRTKGEAVVDFGPALSLSDGHLIRNTRTYTRSLDARTMLDSHPWANTMDLLIYLEGFDAGERYAASISDTQGRATPQDLTCVAPTL